MTDAWKDIIVQTVIRLDASTYEYVHTKRIGFLSSSEKRHKSIFSLKYSFARRASHLKLIYSNTLVSVIFGNQVISIALYKFTLIKVIVINC